jgi:hypothetical protein
MLNKGSKLIGREKMRKKKTPAIPINAKNAKLPIAVIIDKIKAPTTPILLPRTARMPKARYNTKKINEMTDCATNVPRYTLKSMPEIGKRVIISPSKKKAIEYINIRKAIVADNTADLFQYFNKLLSYSDSIIGMLSLNVL